LDGGDEPVLEPKPGEVRLWSDTRVRALFDETHDAAQCLSRLAARLGAAITATAQVRSVAERVWERVWLEDWKSMRFGDRLWVCPTDTGPSSAAAAPTDPGAVIVRLDPGLAFGTGTHPTTALCLEALASLDLVGRTVIDYGCGSGILAIAALKLGAGAAICVDLDPQALLAAQNNALINGVAARFTTQAVDAPLPPADCVLANILAGILIDLCPLLTAACKPDADLVLSGILNEQLAAVTGAYRRSFEIAQCADRDGWSCVHARRRIGARRRETC
jgi:ribosomal protein L11 methyltransferase